MRVFFFSGFGFVIEDVEVAVANLQKIDMAGDDVAVEFEVESARAVICDVIAGKKHGDLDGDGDGIIDEHETLQRFVSFFVCRRSGERQPRKPGCVILFSLDWRVYCRGEF